MSRRAQKRNLTVVADASAAPRVRSTEPGADQAGAPVPHGNPWLRRMEIAAKVMRECWYRINTARHSKKRLHLAETVSLGDKRFLAIVKVDRQEFLVGGSANSVALLAQVSQDCFSEVLEHHRRSQGGEG